MLHGGFPRENRTRLEGCLPLSRSELMLLNLNPEFEKFKDLGCFGLRLWLSHLQNSRFGFEFKAFPSCGARGDLAFCIKPNTALEIFSGKVHVLFQSPVLRESSLCISVTGEGQLESDYWFLRHHSWFLSFLLLGLKMKEVEGKLK